MIVQCSYYQWKNFFEALDKETASTCRTISRKNEHFEALGKEIASTCRTIARKNKHFEALGKETASTCRTIARKNEHVLKKQYMYFKMFVIKLCNFFLSKRHLGCLLIFIGLVSKPGLHLSSCIMFSFLCHFFNYISFYWTCSMILTLLIIIRAQRLNLSLVPDVNF